MAAARVPAAASALVLVKRSWKKSCPKATVVTSSRLSHSATDADEASPRPKSNKTGPKQPIKKMAPKSLKQVFLGNFHGAGR